MGRMTPLSDHLDAETAAALAGDPAALGASEAHLAACADCRRLVLAVRAGLASPEPLGEVPLERLASGLPGSRRGARYAAAAAALLAASALLAHLVRGGDPDTAPPGPHAGPVPAGSPALVEGVPWRALSECLEVELSPGARLRREGAAWRLESGSAWFWQAGEGELQVRSGRVDVALRGPAVFGLRRAASASGTGLSGMFLREVLAGEDGDLEVWVAEGSASLRVAGEGEVALSAGSRWTPGEAPRAATAAEQEAAFAWRRTLGTPLADPPRALGAAAREEGVWTLSGASSLLLQVPDRACRLAFTVRGLSAPVSAGVSCQAGAETAVWELPAAVWDGAAHRVEVRSSAVGVAVSVDGVRARAVSRGGFRANRLSAAPGAGLVLWGGKALVSDLSVRLLESPAR